MEIAAYAHNMGIYIELPEDVACGYKFLEVKFPMPQEQVVAKAWGQSVLCLHGWLDNATTFRGLISLLPRMMGPQGYASTIVVQSPFRQDKDSARPGGCSQLQTPQPS
ncbi:hypothetical protein IHE44_0012196 [Lamprotornis superbus]|uniref:Uncharacterized protein n=1 Tax=Lamprotornis superbus TaxID=245042 RepID=A0A835NQP9_9PASS|nr:hypothetical protein IHE44_0012196 [Lamprotornis superbus]